MSFYLASTVGLVFILKYGSILKFLRDYLISTRYKKFFRELFKCSLCLGFWAGAFHVLVVYVLDPNTPNRFILFPLVSACTAWSADSALQLIQALEVTIMKRKK